MVLVAHTAPAQQVAYKPDSAARAVYMLEQVVYTLALVATCSSPLGPPMARAARPELPSAIDRPRHRISGRRRRCL